MDSVANPGQHQSKLAHDPEADVWSVVMFDLPVRTKKERRQATGFRLLLLDLGYWRAQYSVYVRFTPRAAGSRSAVETIKTNLPEGGEVRILHVSDNQWAKAIRFFKGTPTKPEPEPLQLTIF